MEHAARIRSADQFHSVEIGFLNYNSPKFLDSVKTSVDAGISKIVVVPYFLVPGKFVKVDLPEQIREAEQAFPGIDFVIAEPLGNDARMAEGVIDLSRSAVPSEETDGWTHNAREAAALCKHRSYCPLYESDLCKTRDFVATVKSSGNFVPNQDATKQRSLLLMVHGSPRETANKPMYEVLEHIRSYGAFELADAGFMECNEPDIPTAIQSMVERGAKEIVAVPYFLHPGNHTANDLPELLRAAHAKYPEVGFYLSEHLGRSPKITEILFDRANSAINKK